MAVFKLIPDVPEQRPWLRKDVWRKVNRRNAKLRRMMADGKIKPMSKEEMRNLCASIIKPR